MSCMLTGRTRISGTDHVWQDRHDSAMARRYGLDKPTYLRRKVQAEQRCKWDFTSEATIQRWVDCREGVLAEPK